MGHLRLLHDVKKLNMLQMIQADQDPFMDSWKAYTPT